MNTTQQRQTEFLKRASAALKQQGHPSWSASRRSCAYDSGDGARCAVGHLLPASVDVESIEGLSIARMLRTYRGGEGAVGATRKEKADRLKAALEAAGATEEDFDFLAALQHAHDRTAYIGGNFWPDYRDGALALAQQFGLDAAVIPE